MLHLKPKFAAFGKPGEKVSEVDGVYILEGEGTDIGCNWVIKREMKKSPTLFEFEIRGKIDKQAPWTRLRIEIFDKENDQEPATSFEDDYLTVELDPESFRHLSLPILGIV
ncbi:MAG: hypothetical protein ABIE84_05185, partial [bacterium]